MSKPVCLVIGFGPGVGMGVARAFAQQGFNLVLLSRTPAKTEALCAELSNLGAAVTSLAVDAGDPEALQQTLQKVMAEVGTPQVAIYNAVAPRFSPPSAVTPQQAVDDFKVNVVGALVTAQTLLPAMKQTGSGTLLMTGGGWAHYPDAMASSTSLGKSALWNLTHTLNEEYSPQGLRVGMVSIMGQVAPGTAFDPDKIGAAFLARYQEKGPTFEPEVYYTGVTLSPDELQD